MNFFRKKPPLNQRSQIAVIITFVIAVTILFIVVFINITKVSQIKTSTSQAADKAALSLASQLGSMSHYYKDKVLKGGTEKTIDGKKVIEICGPGWIELGLVVLATAVIAFFLTPLTLIGAAATLLSGATLTAYLSTSMLGGIDNKFNEMTLYNSLRERALFQALISTQSDDVEYKVKTEGSGIFYEDSNGNGAFDPGEPEYDLRGIPEMLNAKKVSRFLAWYYTKRLPLVSDDGLKLALDKFINGTASLPGLKSFTDTDEWSGTEWKIKKLSYVIKPGSGGSDYDVTCTSTASCSSGDTACTQCPDWVKDKTTEQLRIVRIDSSNDAYGGFLKDKLISLLNRLQDKYNGTFCAGASCKIKPDDVDKLIEDLRRFLAGCEDLFNLPISERLRNITQWFPIFYDFTKHKAGSRESLDGNDDYDIYLRLARDWNKINTWIHELETLNNKNSTKTGIIDIIAKAHGKCTWGKGGIIVGSSCNTIRGPNCVICGSVPDCEGGLYHCCWWCCYNPQPCAWGNYYTCCDNPPVCTNGDLYGTKPGWCSTYKNPAPCANNCPGCDVRKFNCDDEAKSFQGQLSYRPPCVPNDPKCTYIDSTSGPTEVEQAIRILNALNGNLARIQMIIGDLADVIEAQLPNDSPLRNELIYAWKDKAQFSHLASVAIDKYPTELPHVTENSTWDRIKRTCRVLNSYVGDFTITTSRYDQDQPTDIAEWKLRRGKKESTTNEFIRLLNGIVTDIQDNAQIDTTQPMVNVILNNYAITSFATAHYGPKKSDIKITKTEGDF